MHTTTMPPADAPTTKPPTTADSQALEFAKRLALVDGRRRTGTSGLLRALAEAHAELADE